MARPSVENPAQGYSRRPGHFSYPHSVGRNSSTSRGLSRTKRATCRQVALPSRATGPHFHVKVRTCVEGNFGAVWLGEGAFPGVGHGGGHFPDARPVRRCRVARGGLLAVPA